MKSLGVLLLVLFVPNVLISSSTIQYSVEDPLKELGLSPPFYQFWKFSPPTEPDVKKAYRELSLKYHPDKSGNSYQEKFYKIREAYEMLKGSGKEADSRRRMYASKYSRYGETLELFSSQYKRFARNIQKYFKSASESLLEDPLGTLKYYAYKWYYSLDQIKFEDCVIFSIMTYIIYLLASFTLFEINSYSKKYFFPPSIPDVEVSYLYE